MSDDSEIEKKLNKAEALGRRKSLEVRHNLGPVDNKIGGYYSYDYKVTSAAGCLMASLSVITQSSLFSYLYFIGFIKIVKDCISSGYREDGFDLKDSTFKPLTYYLLTASIIFVAALTHNFIVPGVKGGLTYYLFEAL